MCHSLQDALAIALKMSLAVPLADIMAYRKVGRAFFQLLEVLSHNHAPVLASTDTATFAFLVGCLSKNVFRARQYCFMLSAAGGAEPQPCPGAGAHRHRDLRLAGVSPS